MKQIILLLLTALTLSSFNLLASSKLQKVEKLMHLMDVVNQLKNNLQAIETNLKAHSQIKDQKQFEETMNQILNLEDLVEFQKRQYMTHFNEFELDDIIKFYESKGGLRLKRVNNQLFSNAMQFAHNQIKKKIHLLKKK